MTSALDAAESAQVPRLPALSERRRLRFAFLFVLYVCQGLPLGFFAYAVPAWMTRNDAPAAAVGGFVAAALLPWSFKFVHGVIMDRFTFLPMGRRRSWLLGAQASMVAGLLVLAVLDPAATATTQLLVLALLVSAAASVQDVAIDGMAVDLVPDGERGRANSLMFGGQALGLGGGAAVSGQMLAHSGVFGAALALATLLACVLGLLTLVRERPGERLLPWTRGEASRHAREAQLHALRPLLGAALGGLFAGHSLPFAAGIILIGLGGGLFLAMAPALAVDGFGWTEADYGQVTGTASVVAAVLVATVVGWLADRFGPRRLAVAMATSAAVLVGATTLGAMSGAPLSGVFAAFVLVFICLETASKACGGAVAMRLCRPEVAASQFALYMACGNLGASMGGGLFGVLSASGGPGAALPAIAGAFLGGALLYGLARAGR